MSDNDRGSESTEASKEFFDLVDLPSFIEAMSKFCKARNERTVNFLSSIQPTPNRNRSCRTRKRRDEHTADKAAQPVQNL